MARYILVNRDVHSKVQNSCRPDLPGSKTANVLGDSCWPYPDNHPDDLGGVKRAKPSRPNIIDQNLNNNPNPGGKGGPLCCLVPLYQRCCNNTSDGNCKTGCTRKWNMKSCRALCVYTRRPNNKVYGDISSNTLEFVGKTRSILIDENIAEEF